MVSIYLLHDDFLDSSQLKTFTNAQIKSLSYKADCPGNGQKSLWEKKKMLVNQHFLLFPQGFQKQKTFFPEVVKFWYTLLCWKGFVLLFMSVGQIWSIGPHFYDITLLFMIKRSLCSISNKCSFHGREIKCLPRYLEVPSSNSREEDTSRYSSVGFVNTMFRVTTGCGLESPGWPTNITK